MPTPTPPQAIIDHGKTIHRVSASLRTLADAFKTTGNMHMADLLRYHAHTLDDAQAELVRATAP